MIFFQFLKYKVRDFAPSNKSIFAKSFLQPIWNGLILRLRVNSAKYIARLLSNLANGQSLKPDNHTKNDQR